MGATNVRVRIALVVAVLSLIAIGTASCGSGSDAGDQRAGAAGIDYRPVLRTVPAGATPSVVAAVGATVREPYQLTVQRSHAGRSYELGPVVLDSPQIVAAEPRYSGGEWQVAERIVSRTTDLEHLASACRDHAATCPATLGDAHALAVEVGGELAGLAELRHSAEGDWMVITDRFDESDARGLVNTLIASDAVT